MKILLVHNRYKVEGGEEVVFEQERELLQHAGHEVIVYSRSNFEADNYGGARKLTLLKNIAWSTSSKQEVADLLRTHRPEIVHVHNPFMMISPAVFEACREAGIPVVQTLHNYRLFCPAANFIRDGKPCEECAEHSTLRGVRHACYRNSRMATASVALMITVQRRWRAYPDVFIALTEFSRQKFIAHGIPPEKLVVKPNFVAPDPGERTAPGDYAVIAGRLSEEKGVDTVLEAWRHLGRDVPLVVVGDGPLLDSARQTATDLKLDNIRFLGRQPRPKTLQIIKSAKFLVTASQCYENFPMGIAEAFACGVPVICSKLGGMAEVVENNSTGLHFAHANPVDLASKVHWAWLHPAEMRQMGKQARREYEAKYTPEKNYPQLMSIYRRAVQGVAHTTFDEAEVGFSLSRG